MTFEEFYSLYRTRLYPPPSSTLLTLPPFFTSLYLPPSPFSLQSYLYPRSTARLPLTLDLSLKDGDRNWTTKLVDPTLRSKLYSAVVYEQPTLQSSSLSSLLTSLPPSLPPFPYLPPSFPPSLLLLLHLPPSLPPSFLTSPSSLPSLHPPSTSDYTRTSTWTDPRSLTSAPLTEFEWNVLPPGWERFLDNHGDIYYVK